MEVTTDKPGPPVLEEKIILTFPQHKKPKSTCIICGKEGGSHLLKIHVRGARWQTYLDLLCYIGVDLSYIDFTIDVQLFLCNTCIRIADKLRGCKEICQEQLEKYGIFKINSKRLPDHAYHMSENKRMKSDEIKISLNTESVNDEAAATSKEGQEKKFRIINLNGLPKLKSSTKPNVKLELNSEPVAPPAETDACTICEGISAFETVESNVMNDISNTNANDCRFKESFQKNRTNDGKGTMASDTSKDSVSGAAELSTMDENSSTSASGTIDSTVSSATVWTIYGGEHQRYSEVEEPVRPAILDEPENDKKKRGRKSGFLYALEYLNASAQEHNYAMTNPDTIISQHHLSALVKCTADEIPKEEIDALKEFLTNHLNRTNDLPMYIINQLPVLERRLHVAWLLKLELNLDRLCEKKTGSILRSRPDEMIDGFFMKKLVVEMHHLAPRLLDILTTMCCPLHQVRDRSRSPMVVLYAIALHSRNLEMAAMQKLVGSACIHFKVENELMNILNKLHLAIPPDSKNKLRNQMGDTDAHALFEVLCQLNDIGHERYKKK